MAHVIINGVSAEEAAAQISVNDRGFRFGDGVFETIPIHGGIPYVWEYHLERLNAGLSALRIACATDTLLSQVMMLLNENKVMEGLVRIAISRGTGSRGYLPLPAIPPSVIVQTLEKPSPPARALALWLSAYEKISPRALPTHCKTAQGVNSMLARMEAADHGCDEALQRNGAGYIAEASAANIFWLNDNTLHTPSLACGALAGVTRRRIMELSPYRIVQGEYTLENLCAAQAVVLTNATLGVMPVATLQGNGTWNSIALAKELTRLRNEDIEKYTVRARELLA